MPLSTTRQPPAHRHAEGGGDRARSLRYRSQSREGRRGTRARAKGRARRPFTSAGEAEAAAAIPPSRRRRLTRPRPSQHAPRGSPSGQHCPDYNSRQAPRGALTTATAAPLPPARPSSHRLRPLRGSVQQLVQLRKHGGRAAAAEKTRTLPGGERRCGLPLVTSAHALSGAEGRRLLEGRGAMAGGRPRSPQRPGRASGAARPYPASAGVPGRVPDVPGEISSIFPGSLWRCGWAQRRGLPRRPCSPSGSLGRDEQRRWSHSPWCSAGPRGLLLVLWVHPAAGLGLFPVVELREDPVSP